MQFPSDKTIKQATTAYRTKSGETGSLKFTVKGKPLADNLTLAESNLSDGTVITVEKPTNKPNPVPKPNPDPKPNPSPQVNIPQQNGDFVNLIFEQKTGGQAIAIQISLDKKVSDAITSYRNKMLVEGEIRFIFNGQNLKPELSLREAGLKNSSKITVITTKDIEGA